MRIDSIAQALPLETRRKLKAEPKCLANLFAAYGGLQSVDQAFTAARIA